MSAGRSRFTFHAWKISWAVIEVSIGLPMPSCGV